MRKSKKKKEKKQKKKTKRKPPLTPCFKHAGSDWRDHQAA
jgi:hypothetical protein